MSETKKVKAPNSNGTFRYRTNGSIEYRFTYKDEEGESRRKSVSGRTESECIQKAEMFLATEMRKSAAVDYRATIPELLRKKYLRDYSMGFTSEPGYARNLESIKKIENGRIGQVPIKEITEADIDAFLASLVSYTDSTIEKTFRQLKYAFEEAAERGILEKNLIKEHRIRRPKSRKDRERICSLNEEEQREFISALTEYKNHQRNCYKKQLLIELYTGMRMGEINALKPENVDFKRGLIHINGTISCGLNHRTFYRNHTKTEAGCRDIPINDLVKPVLQEAIEEMKENEEGLIFWDYNKNEPITTTQVCSFYRRVCEKCGIPHGGQHALRHTFATRCIEAGVEPVVLKTWLGHTNIHITLDTYADVYNQLTDKNINRLEAHLGALNLGI